MIYNNIQTKNVNSCLSTFDTVSLSYCLLFNNFNSFDHFISDFTVFDFSSKIKNLLDNKTNSVYQLKIDVYKLSEHIKKSILGLEQFSIVQATCIYSNSSNNSRSLDLNIKFNAKALKYNYLDNINKNNFSSVSDYLCSLLSKYCKISPDMLYSSNLRTVDYTKNIKCDNYSVYDTLVSLSKIMYPNRTLKRIHKDFINDCTLYFHTSQKSKDKLYSKYNDLKKLSNDDNYSNFKLYSDFLLTANSDNILRYEVTFNKHKSIKKYFDVKSDDNNFIHFNDLLESKSNVIYNRFDKYFNKTQKGFFKMINNDISISDFKNIKEHQLYLLGKSLYSQYKDNYDLMKKDIYSFKSVNRSTNYRNYEHYKKAISFYLLKSGSLDIDYKQCFFDFYNKLENIDKYCI